jgi:putative MATE family efflux protein
VEAQRLKRIAKLSLPIIGGMVSQNILNLVDTAMVGRLPDSNAALAAVGLGGFATFMCQAVLLGISAGVQATAARRKGEGNAARMAVSLNAALLMIVCIAPFFSTVLHFLVPVAYPFLNSDPAVIALGIPYLQIRIWAIVFVSTNFAFRGYWNGVDLSHLYMSTLVVMHSCNIVLNYLLIFGNFGFPELGVAGAGLATAISTVIGTACYMVLGFLKARDNGFLKARPSRLEFHNLTRLSLPNSLQQFAFATGFTTLYWIIGQVGTVELAAANVLINVTLVAILPGLAMGMTSATLVGQALGRRDPVDARSWGWDVVKVGMVTLALLGLPMWLVPDLILTVFIQDPITIDVARAPMRLVGLTIAFEGIGLVLMHSLLGAGDAKKVMLVSIATQWIVFLPLAYIAGPVLGFDLFAIWVLQALYRLLQSAIFFTLWHRGGWTGIEI